MKIRVFASIFLLICIFFSLSAEFSARLRDSVISKAMAVAHVGLSKAPSKTLTETQDMQRLQIENLTLKEHLEQIQDYLLSDEKLERDKKLIEELHDRQIPLDEAYILRREQELFKKMQAELRALHAKVIFREPIAWNSCLWVNVGEQDNKDKHSPIVALNSPVVSGDAIVGVIDYVGKRQSRVRLITDRSVCVSARILRGSSQNRLLLDPLSLVIDQLKYREDVFFSKEELTQTLRIMEALQDNLKASISDRYLAKGEIQGTSSSFWRSRSLTLKGFGFNYDFADEEGEAKDLRTGKSFKNTSESQGEMLIQEGDLLVTTGYDGVFPAGLKIGYVSEVAPLEEGAIFYEIKAEAAAYHLYELSYVQILPPMKEPLLEEKEA